MNTHKQTAAETPQTPDTDILEETVLAEPGKLSLAARALCSRRFVLFCLATAIVAQVLLLLLGLAQKLSTMSPPGEAETLRKELTEARLQTIRAERRVAELDKALSQAVDFAGTIYSGSAGIGGAAVSAIQTEEPDEEVTDHNAAPPLRAADADMLIFEETGISITRETPEDLTPTAEDTPAQVIQKTEAAGEFDNLMRQGISALVSGDMRRCVLSFEEAAGIMPEHPALLYYYGMAYDKLLNPEKAREYYTKVFNMRSTAGKYFERASRRLKHGFDQPSDLRGKVSFGPYTHSHTSDPEAGEQVSMRLPILVAPETEISPQDIFIHIQFFVLVNDRKILYSPIDPVVMWENETQDWSDHEENILISYNLPPLTKEEKDAYGEMTYYGFTAKFFYKGEPIDCLSNPSALILHEQIINARESTRKHTTPSSLLPDDGLAPIDDIALPAYGTESGLPTDATEPAAPTTDGTEAEPKTPFAEFLEDLESSDATE